MDTYLEPDTDPVKATEEVIEVDVTQNNIEDINRQNEIELLSKRQNQERTAWVLKSLSEIATYGNYGSTTSHGQIQNQNTGSNQLLNYNAMTAVEKEAIKNLPISVTNLMCDVYQQRQRCVQENTNLIYQTKKVHLELERLGNEKKNMKEKLVVSNEDCKAAESRVQSMIEQHKGEKKLWNEERKHLLKLNQTLQQKETQFMTALKKKDREYEKLQRQITTCLSKQNNGRSFPIRSIEILSRGLQDSKDIVAPQKGVPMNHKDTIAQMKGEYDDFSGGDEAGIDKILISAYEKRQNELTTENNSLRMLLHELHQEYKELYKNYNDFNDDFKSIKEKYISEYKKYEEYSYYYKQYLRQQQRQLEIHQEMDRRENRTESEVKALSEDANVKTIKGGLLAWPKENNENSNFVLNSATSNCSDQKVHRDDDQIYLSQSSKGIKGGKMPSDAKPRQNISSLKLPDGHDLKSSCEQLPCEYLCASIGVPLKEAMKQMQVNIENDRQNNITEYQKSVLAKQDQNLSNMSSESGV